jgi:hypothetical protein
MKFKELLEEKEKHVLSLNYNITFQRITQLFGRSLYIKYFVKNADSARIRKLNKDF